MNYKKILSVVILVGVLLGLLFLSAQYSFKKEIETSWTIQEESQQVLQQIEKKKVSYIINPGQGESKEYQVIPSLNSTVFSLLEELSEKENFEISYKIYPEMGVFVESIAGVENGRDGKYWQYWVNGKLPMVAADKFQVQEGNVVEWKFEISQF